MDLLAATAALARAWFAEPASSAQAWFAAAVGLALTLAAVYEHFRKKETAQATGVLLAALGLFAWAGLQGPIYYVAVIVAAAILIPWLIWGRRPRRAWAAFVAWLPFTIQRKRRQEVVTGPPGERGLWDFRRDGDRAMELMTALLLEMTASMEGHSKKLGRHGRRMDRQSRRNPSVERAYKLSERSASDIERHAVTMDSLETRYREATADMIQNFKDWLGGQPSGTDLTVWKTALRAMGVGAKEGVTGTKAYKKAVQGLRAQNTSQPINRATDHLVVVLDRIIKDMDAAARFAASGGR
jgi:hypothetical protein